MTLSLASVSKKVSRRFRLADVSFDVGAGEFVVILGPSGCGKSTTLRLIAGLERVDAGTISIGGTVVAGADVHSQPRDRHLSMVFQSLALWPHMRAGKQLDFVLKGRALGRRERKGRIERYLELVGLLDRRRAYPHQLSGGELQRLALARALVVEPSLVLLDEPLSAADRALRQRLLLEMRRIQRELAIPMLYVTHDQEEALAVADRIVVMREGRVEQTGSPREIYEGPANRFVAGFVGTNNLLLATGGAGGSLSTSLGTVRGSASSNGSGSTWISLRPEELQVGDDGVECTVESGTYQGDRWLLTVRLGEERFFLFAGAPPEIGTRVRVRITGEGRVLGDSSPADRESER